MAQRMCTISIRLLQRYSDILEILRQRRAYYSAQFYEIPIIQGESPEVSKSCEAIPSSSKAVKVEDIDEGLFFERIYESDFLFDNFRRDRSGAVG